MLSSTKIYADCNATTPLAPEVIKSIEESMINHWANPNSSHEHGKEARKAIDVARTSVAQMVGALPTEIIFVSGGTEANCMAIHSVLEHSKVFDKANNNTNKKPHIITTLVEHDAIKLHLTQKFGKEIEVTHLPIENLETDVLNSIQPSTCLITIMLANNETGLIFPVASIARRLIEINKKRKQEGLARIFLHTDAAQAIGKICVNVRELNVDYLTIVGHKFYGPRIGALYCRGCPNEAPVYPLFFGGGQERGFRAGTENTPMIAGLGAASKIVHEDLDKHIMQLQKVRNYLRQQLKESFGKCVRFNCLDSCDVKNPEKCAVTNETETLSQPLLPNTCSISFHIKEVTGIEILRNCQKLLASTGAACNAVEDSIGVLGASGVCSFHAARTIRLSIGRSSTVEEMDYIVSDLQQAVSKLL